MSKSNDVRAQNKTFLSSI